MVAALFILVTMKLGRLKLNAPLMLAAVLLGSAAQAQCPDGSPPPCVTRAPTTRAVPPASERARRMMFLPFRNVTRRAEQDWLVSGAPLMLAQALGQFRDLQLVPE